MTIETDVIIESYEYSPGYFVEEEDISVASSVQFRFFSKFMNKNIIGRCEGQHDVRALIYAAEKKLPVHLVIASITCSVDVRKIIYGDSKEIDVRYTSHVLHVSDVHYPTDPNGHITSPDLTVIREGKRKHTKGKG